MEDICLKPTNGEELRFTGRLFSERKYFDEDTGFNVRHELYLTDDGAQVYYVVRSRGRDRERHAYRLRMRDDICVIDNGRFEVSMGYDLLSLAVSRLCGIGEGAMPSREQMEELLRAANA